ncbi:hypothetical protein AB2568_025530 [Bacillus mycoides]|uniref:hypothetical protein n=1 Tax=Bacillus mycoides TaxID=1405 RepID=UPI0034646E1C
MLRDLEEIVVKIKKEHIRGYMQESLNCYNAKSYRGSVIMATIAAMHDLYEKIDGLANSVTEARRLIEDINVRKSNESIYEKYMVEQAAAMSILTPAEKTKILSYLDIRNQCAHPNEHVSTAEEARAVFTGYIDTIISQPALLGPSYISNFVSRLESSSFFPTYKKEDIIDTVNEELKKLHDKTKKPLAKKLIAIIETGEVNEVKCKNANCFISGMLVVIKDEQQLRNICGEFSNLIERENLFGSILYMTKMVPEMVNLLETIDRKRYISKLITIINEVEAVKENEVVQLLLERRILATHEINELVEKYAHEIQDSVQKVAGVTSRSSVSNLKKYTKPVSILNISILDNLFFEKLLELIRDGDYNNVNDSLEMLLELDNDFIKRMDAKYHTDVVIQIIRQANGPGRGSDKANEILKEKFSVISCLVDYFLEYTTQNYEQLSYVMIKQHLEVPNMLKIIDSTNNHDFLQKIVDLIKEFVNEDVLENSYLLDNISRNIKKDYNFENWLNISEQIERFLEESSVS